MSPLAPDGARREAREQWIYRRPRSGVQGFRLFCFPYGGGTAAAFADWDDSLGAGIEVCAIELPGRRMRFREQPVRNLNALAEAATDGLTPYLDTDFGLFGHSMGALVAFEVARCLRDRGLARPRALFLSAAAAPHARRAAGQPWRLPDREFLSVINAYGGMPPDVLTDPGMSGLLEIFLPVLRADFEAFGTYQYLPGSPLEFPVHVYGGISDEQVPPPALTAWRDIAGGLCSVEFFRGGHFFLREQRDELTRSIADHIARQDFLSAG